MNWREKQRQVERTENLPVVLKTAYHEEKCDADQETKTVYSQELVH